jgi:uncharacterized OB-fold protein
LPVPNSEDETFWQEAAAHRLVLPRCTSCGHTWFPAYARCPACLSEAREWVDAAGTATVVGWTIMHRRYLPAFPTPYHVALVELYEGPRMFATIDGYDLEHPPIGLTVRVRFEVVDGFTLPQFAPADDGEGP